MRGQPRYLFDVADMDKRMHIAWRAPMVAKAIVDVFSPRHVLDLGCGNGDIVDGLLGLRVDAWGVDSSSAAGRMIKPYFIRGDLCKPTTTWTVPKRHSDDGFPILPVFPSDLAICLEVFSILPEEQHEAALKTVLACGTTLLVNWLSAAVEKEALRAAGFIPNVPAIESLRMRLDHWKHRDAFKAFCVTGEVWRRRA